ncbi:ATP-binding cassette domain-containing protein [Nocardiopsis sp. B62]|uniref:ATP-binding cassette domain-containing protein n=1 Tax=Nocardiopsis sp. B62 TaxID=2824874 RepID=UPI001B39473B|nr:ATP-binding cassette domain-containing protein [Nocardiopsis sp. B62]
MLGTGTRLRSQLALNEVSRRYAGHTVLDRASLTISPGERVGVIGDNGSGKSTPLRLLAGAEDPDNGKLTVRPRGGGGHLPQTMERVPGGVPLGAVADAINDALRDLRDRVRDARPCGASAVHGSPPGAPRRGPDQRLRRVMSTCLFVDISART